MSKPIKNLIRKELARQLEGVSEVAVVSVMGVDGNTNNSLRGELAEKGIRVMVVKNAMARKAFEDIGIAEAGALLEGPCALAYGGESVVDVVRELVDRAKTIPGLEVKGALMEGELFGSDRIEELSKYPTRSEALGRVSSIALAPGATLVGAVLGPGSVIAGLLKAIEEKQEDGEE